MHRRHPILTLTAAGLTLATLVALLAVWPDLSTWLTDRIQATATNTILVLPAPTRVDVAVAALVVTAVAAVAVATAPDRRRVARWGMGSAGLVAVLAVAACLMGAALPQTTRPTGLDVRQADEQALAVLMRSYSPATGRFSADPTQAWWQSAAALDVVVQAERGLGIHTFDRDLIHSYETNLDVAALGIRDYRTGNFDDAGWWGIAWLHVYQWTGGDSRLLATAEQIDDYLATGWTSSCRGGVAWGQPWVRGGTQKGVITNALYATLSAQLATETGSPVYQQRAERAWTWLHTSGLVRPGRLALDHLDPATCKPVGVVWSYNQGELIAAAQAMGDLAEARALAAAVVASPRLNPGGTLTDPCEAAGTCGIDGPVFKGVLAGALGDLNAATPGHPWSAYLTRQATTVYEHDRTPAGAYGLRWAGPVDATSFSRTASVLALYTATLGSTR